MEGVTGFAMRAFFSLASGAPAQGTPFLRVTGTHPHRALPREFAPELFELKDVVPYRLVPQLMAVETDDFLRTAELFREAVPFIELNCGCPSPTCVGKGAGSSLLRVADDFHDTVRVLVRALGPGRLAVKMRLGFLAAEEFPTLLEGVREAPLARLTIHGRTRPQGYKGQADWRPMALATDRAAAPVFASGDVVDRKSLDERLAVAPRISGVLIGRGMLRNPWVLGELRDGAPARVQAEALVLAVAVQARLQEIAQEDAGALYALVKEGLLERTCGVDAERWRQVLGRLTKAQPAALEGSRQILGRAKLLWSYLRSSLPEPCFEPRVLRARTLGELLSGIETVARQASGPGGELTFRHRQDLDWLYAGEGRKQEAGPSGEQRQDEAGEQRV